MVLVPPDFTSGAAYRFPQLVLSYQRGQQVAQPAKLQF
jgi:hypothetical protein